MGHASKLTSTGGTVHNGSYGETTGRARSSNNAGTGWFMPQTDGQPARTKSGAGCADCNDGQASKKKNK